MPAAMTFTSLQTDIQNYLERGSSVVNDPIVFAQIPRLINLGERRCVQTLKVQGFLEVNTNSFQVGVSVYAKPDRWRATATFNFGSGANNNVRTVLVSREYGYMRQNFPDDSVTDKPVCYADYQYNFWLIAPTPDQAYPFECVCYHEPALLDSINTTNWLTTYAPNLLLYASLLEATPFLKNDERIPIWEQFFQESAANIGKEDLKKIFDRNAQRNSA